MKSSLPYYVMRHGRHYASSAPTVFEVRKTTSVMRAAWFLGRIEAKAWASTLGKGWKVVAIDEDGKPWPVQEG